MSLSDEMEQLVAKEQHEASLLLDANASVDDLHFSGRLQESDYLSIIHALEDSVCQEILEEKVEKWDEELRLAERMVELEDAELEAMLDGMNITEEPQRVLQAIAKRQQPNLL